MPYNPGVTDQSGVLLGQGIQNAGRSIAAAMEKRDEEIKLRSREMKGVQELLEARGIATKPETSTWSLEQAKARLEADVLNKAEQDRQQRREMIELQKKSMEAEILRKAEEEKAITARGAFAGDLARQAEPNMVLDPSNPEFGKPMPIKLPGILAALERNKGAMRGMSTEDLLKIAQRGRMEPGTVLQIPGAEGHVAMVAGADGGLVVVPKGGVKAETESQKQDRLKTEEEIKKLKRENEAAAATAGGSGSAPSDTQTRMGKLRSNVDFYERKIARGDEFPGPEVSWGVLDPRSKKQAEDVEELMRNLEKYPAERQGGELEALRLKFPEISKKVPRTTSAAPAAGGPEKGKVDPTEALAEAQRALATGKVTVEQVKARLKEYGIEVK